LFAELGWSPVSALEETFGAPSPGLAAHAEPLTRPSATLSRPTGEGQVGEGASLGRETKGEVVLVSRLRAALERLNPALPPEAITAAVDELTRDRSAMSRFSGQMNLKTN
jgi:type I restriction enzyme R subunit